MDERGQGWVALRLQSEPALKFPPAVTRQSCLGLGPCGWFIRRWGRRGCAGKAAPSGHVASCRPADPCRCPQVKLSGFRTGHETHPVQVALGSDAFPRGLCLAWTGSRLTALLLRSLCCCSEDKVRDTDLTHDVPVTET